MIRNCVARTLLQKSIGNSYRRNDFLLKLKNHEKILPSTKNFNFHTSVMVLKETPKNDFSEIPNSGQDTSLYTCPICKSVYNNSQDYVICFDECKFEQENKMPNVVKFGLPLVLCVFLYQFWKRKNNHEVTLKDISDYLDNYYSEHQINLEILHKEFDDQFKSALEKECEAEKEFKDIEPSFLYTDFKINDTKVIVIGARFQRLQNRKDISAIIRNILTLRQFPTKSMTSLTFCYNVFLF